MSENDEIKSNDVLKVMGAGAAVVFGLMFVFALFIGCAIPDSEKRGHFGDQFGAINALFSGLAFLGLIVTIAVQTRDLRIQTKALSEQIKESSEQKMELRRSAEAQEAANQIQLLHMKLETVRMKFDHSLQRAKFQVAVTERDNEMQKAVESIVSIESIIDRMMLKVGEIYQNQRSTEEG